MLRLSFRLRVLDKDIALGVLLPLNLCFYNFISLGYRVIFTSKKFFYATKILRQKKKSNYIPVVLKVKVTILRLTNGYIWNRFDAFLEVGSILQ